MFTEQSKLFLPLPKFLGSFLLRKNKNCFEVLFILTKNIFIPRDCRVVSMITSKLLAMTGRKSYKVESRKL